MGTFRHATVCATGGVQLSLELVGLGNSFGISSLCTLCSQHGGSEGQRLFFPLRNLTFVSITSRSSKIPLFVNLLCIGYELLRIFQLTKAICSAVELLSLLREDLSTNVDVLLQACFLETPSTLWAGYKKTSIIFWWQAASQANVQMIQVGTACDSTTWPMIPSWSGCSGRDAHGRC
jgi:hypothetical protein